jgi:hypothetical protein
MLQLLSVKLIGCVQCERQSKQVEGLIARFPQHSWRSVSPSSQMTLQNQTGVGKG